MASNGIPIRRTSLCALTVISASVYCAITTPVAAQQPVAPVPPAPAVDGAPTLQEPVAPGDQKRRESDFDLASDSRVDKLFGEIRQVDELPPIRAPHAQSPAADAIFGAEATGRKSSDVGDLLKRSKSAHGVSIQHRTPVISDTRLRGQRVGQVLASGSYWAPARMDLDTMMSKIDSRLIENAILIKGPYSGRYGPGFRFVDLDFIHTPRYANGFEAHGQTGTTYNTNGQQWDARQSFWGGNETSGFHISYGHKTGNNYETGNGSSMPSSYKSRDLFVALGHDLSEYESLEFNYIRLDQTDVEFPGLVFDINFLVTDGYEVTYTNTNPDLGDRFTTEVWYNRTRFEGDTLRWGKNQQIPNLQTDLYSPSGTDGYGITDVDALSGGYRMETTFLRETCTGHEGQFSIGTDLILQNQELNDIEPLIPNPNDNNFPIPRSNSVDIGLYIEDIQEYTDRLTVTAGGRIDGVFTDAENTVDGVPMSMSTLKFSELNQQFLLGAAYLTGAYKLTPKWTLDAGFGTSHRPPTLTELYAESSFIGSLQRGVTFLQGDPQLKPEKLIQVDLGTHYDGDDVRLGLFGHYAWIHDYITYDLVAASGADGFPQGASFTNTDLATLAGFEAYGQYDLTQMVSLFGVVDYTEGRDHSRNDPARLMAGAIRSGVNRDKEPLPGISPLESRLGILLQDPSPERRWGVEFAARVVDNQDRVAASLEEIETPGFTTYNLRTYTRINQWLLTAGIENIFDKYYREHIDYRSGRGVYRPGVSFYAGAQVTY